MVEKDENTKAVRQYYEQLYARDKQDSPEQTRISMVRRMANYLSQSLPTKYVLDLGSGRQALFRQFNSAHHQQPWFSKYHFFSLELARVNRLLMHNQANFAHLQGSGEHLPFPTETIGLVCANMSLTLMPPKTIFEIARVLAPNGILLANLQGPQSINLESIQDPKVKSIRQYLETAGRIYQTETEITNALSKAGLNPETINRRSDTLYSWWEVDAIKLPNQA